MRFALSTEHTSWCFKYCLVTCITLVSHKTRNPPSIHLNCVGLHWIVEDCVRWLQSGIVLNCPWILWIACVLQLIQDSQSTVQSRKSARNSQNAVAIENRKINDCMRIARFREDHLLTIFPYSNNSKNLAPLIFRFKRGKIHNFECKENHLIL